MAKSKLGRGLSTLTASGPAVLSTEQAAMHDETHAAAAIERARYERCVLDFESEIYRRRDAMRAEHLSNMQEIFAVTQSE